MSGRASRYLRVAVLASVFSSILALRIYRIDEHFLLLEDQIRDWAIALGPLTKLPLVGPPTHVGGYTIGPAFYWILWGIRVTFGPWFQNLPHAGGIGQAALQSAADVLLLYAVWRRTRSVWIGLTTVVLVATAGYDLHLAAVIWNPMVGAALAKIATALVLLGWPERSRAGVAVTAAVAWCGVQSYTGVIFVAVSVFVAILAPPFERRDRAALLRNGGIIVLVVAALQIPYALHQLSTGFRQSAMGAVTGSVARILTGQDPPQLTNSWAGYFGAFHRIQVVPWSAPWSVWALIACGVVVAIRYRRDPTLLAVTLLPQIMAIVGYAFYVGDFLDSYYYFSLMPAAVLTVVLALTAMPSRPMAQAISIALFAMSVAISPTRIAYAHVLPRMPEYRILVEASRKIAKVPQPMREIQTAFKLPPTADPAFVYKILGGHIDSASPFVAVIKSDGGVEFQKIQP
jgi:hypothetical protein